MQKKKDIGIAHSRQAHQIGLSLMAFSPMRLPFNPKNLIGPDMLHDYKQEDPL